MGLMLRHIHEIQSLCMQKCRRHYSKCIRSESDWHSRIPDYVIKVARQLGIDPTAMKVLFNKLLLTSNSAHELCAQPAEATTTATTTIIRTTRSRRTWHLKPPQSSSFGWRALIISFVACALQNGNGHEKAMSQELEVSKVAGVGVGGGGLWLELANGVETICGLAWLINDAHSQGSDGRLTLTLVLASTSTAAVAPTLPERRHPHGVPTYTDITFKFETSTPRLSGCNSTLFTCPRPQLQLRLRPPPPPLVLASIRRTQRASSLCLWVAGAVACYCSWVCVCVSVCVCGATEDYTT